MGTIKDLKFWSYKVLPLAYDDSLSYYEVVSKVVAKLNEVIGATNELPKNISAEIKKQLTGEGDVFDNLFNGLINAIATKEGDSVTFTRNEKQGGEIVWLGDTLYEVVMPMQAGVNYIVGTNIVPVNITVELNKIKDYISANNEYFHERATANHDSQTYLFWKDKLYRVDADIKVNDILAEKITVDGNTTGQLTLVNVMDEVTTHYIEMHESDNNLQTQIDGNDRDIEKLQNDLTTETTRATNRENSIDSRISNIVSQSGNDNTEIVDGRKTSEKTGGTTEQTIGDAIRLQSLLALSATDKFIQTEDDLASYIPSKDIKDQPINTIVRYGSFNEGVLAENPFPNSYFTAIKINFSRYGAYANFYTFLAVNDNLTLKLGYCGGGNSITWREITIDTNTILKGNNIFIDNETTLSNYIPSKDLSNQPLNTIVQYAAFTDEQLKNNPVPNKYFVCIKFTPNVIGNYSTFNTYIVFADTVYFGAQNGANYISWINLLNNSNNYLKSSQFINSEDELTAFIPSKNIVDQPVNTIAQYGNFTKDQLKNNPFPNSYFACIKLNYNTSGSNAGFSTYIAITGANLLFGQNWGSDNITWYYSSDVTAEKKYESYKIFMKVGCVGDSFTEGYIVNTKDNSVSMNKDYSWPTFMQNDSGRIYKNYGVSGATSLNWLEANRGYKEAQKEKCQLYIIGLGINDSNTYELGKIDDCENANANTFYRYYYNLLTKVHELNEEAFLFCLTMGTDETSNTGKFNKAISDIVEKYSTNLNAILFDLHSYTKYYSNPVISKDFYSSHYSAIGYNAFAKNMEDIFSEYINTHIDTFKNVAFIPYE